MLRRVLAVVAGSVVAVLTVAGVDGAVASMYQLPPGADPRDSASMASAIGAMPKAALAMMVSGWALAAAVGSFVAAMLAPVSRLGHGLIVTGLLMAATVSNLMTIPHPNWMWVAAAILVPLAGWGAARGAVKLKGDATPGGGVTAAGGTS